MPSEVVINIKPKGNKAKSYFFLALILIIVALIIFLASFFIGRIGTQNGVFVSKPTTQVSATREGWFVLEAKTYTIEYPDGWKVQENARKDPVGAKITSSKGEINFWQNQTREPRFSSEQKSNIVAQKSSDLSVDKRKAIATKYTYKDGSFFLTVVVPAKDPVKSVVFWAAWSPQDTEKVITDIISTYKSK
jgi:hypothetical protein